MIFTCQWIRKSAETEAVGFGKQALSCTHNVVTNFYKMLRSSNEINFFKILGNFGIQLLSHW